MLAEYIETHRNEQTPAFNTVAFVTPEIPEDAVQERLKGTAPAVARNVMATLYSLESMESRLALASEFGTRSGSILRGKAAEKLDITINHLEDAGLDATALRRMKGRRTKGARGRLHNEPKNLASASGMDMAYEA